MEDKNLVAFEVAMCKLKNNADLHPMKEGVYKYANGQYEATIYISTNEIKKFLRRITIYETHGSVLINKETINFEIEETVPVIYNRAKEKISEVQAYKDNQLIENLKKHLC